MTKAKRDQAWVKICEEIQKAVSPPDELRDPAASLLPSVTAIRDVAVEIAYAVALEAKEGGLAPAREPEALRREVVESQWTPEYIPY